MLEESEHSKILRTTKHLREVGYLILYSPHPDILRPDFVEDSRMTGLSHPHLNPRIRYGACFPFKREEDIDFPLP